jgi:hypothetical protein
MRRQPAYAILLLSLCVAGCSAAAWNPVHWFKKAPPPAAPVVQVLTIEPGSANTSDRFAQSWDGARLIVDIESPSGVGRATLRPANGPWPLRLAFRMHVSALEGFEVRGAQNMRISLGAEPLTEPALIDLPYGIYVKDTSQIDIQWVDHYR